MCLLHEMIFFGDRFLFLDRRSTMMIYLYLILSLRFFNLMVQIRLFKRGQRLLKLYSTLKILIMMENVR